MVKSKSIKKVVKSNRVVLKFLVVLIIFTYGLYIYNIYATTRKSVRSLYELNYNMLNNYINKSIRQTKEVSALPLHLIPNFVKFNENVHSVHIIDQQGVITYSYPYKSLVDVSYNNLPIIVRALETGELQTQILSYSLGQYGTALGIVYPVDNKLYMVNYSFNPVFHEISNSSLFVTTDSRGNIIITNSSGGLFPTNLSRKDGIIPLEKLVVINREMKSISSRLYFVYYIDEYINRAFDLGLLSLFLLSIIVFVFRFSRNNYRVIMEDIQLLENKSRDLINAIEGHRSKLVKIDKEFNAMNLLGQTLEKAKTNFRETKYAFTSYKKMVNEMLRLLEEVTMQNEEISAMNQEISVSYEAINTYQNKILAIIDLLSKIDPEAPLKGFLQDIVQLAVELIPAADAGSAGIKEGKYFKFLAQYGYDDLLTEVDFPEEILMCSENPVIFKNVNNSYLEKNPEEYKRVFAEVGSSRIKSTLVVGLKTQDIIGNIFIDTFQAEKEFTSEDKRVLEAISKVSSILIYLKLSLTELDETYLGVIKALADAVELKDKYTKGHSERVARYSLKLGEYLNLSPERLRVLKEAALLHDIGKIGVPDLILNKPGKLNDREYVQVRKHSVYGSRILENVNNFERVASIVRHHHERWDGHGYPDGLKGKEIPLESRIIALFDAFDTILTSRSYKDALPFEYAIKEVRENAGTQFDPELTGKFLDVVTEEWVLSSS
ncbi:HD-GYP domain-containing protein [Halothermothrix orenii]|uniref:Metal dependent phosphohydrolase n=1 Tax=Halothermothrix orenii (strain H 168 / OCM 544 / DSM 9562) TaxID=373903 RepID=B8CYH3_HALOH|nr:HD-GYP domain-containing protein [Halothermothrix orenii]ACL70342.1 metal dependent phosphohydrolase [Halothermothrix orenii H 168]